MFQLRNKYKIPKLSGFPLYAHALDSSILKHPLLTKIDKQGKAKTKQNTN